jgi:O-antigen/teichoic acid export membrane protein
MPTANDKRIAKNAVYLYGRMMLTIFVSLYTSRVVLDVLGVSDYGLYNVVAGIVLILGFINGTMSGATQRFISFELGVGDKDKLRRTFSSAMTVHVAIALIVFVLAETIGLWYVNDQLVIAPERMVAANWVFQLSVLAAVATFIQIPYIAAIMAHERMGYFAVVAMTNVVLKLAIILMVKYIATSDNLIFYAALFLLVSWIVAAMYIVYSKLNFEECRWSLHNDGKITRSLLGFCSWDIYGNLAFTMRAQGVLVVLNRFGGTVLNAAGGLCYQVSGTICSFAGSVITAFRPQIVQQYAKGNLPYVLTLLNNCARYALLLLGLLIIPLIIGMDSLLGYWLVEPPAYTAAFCRISLIAVCGELTTSVLSAGVHATGNVKRVSFITGSLYVGELPIMWYLLQWTGNPPIVYCVHLVMIFVIVYVNSWILKVQMHEFQIGRFWWRGVMTPMLILLGGFVVTYFATLGWQLDILHLIGCGLISTAVVAVLSWFFAIDDDLREQFRAKIKLKLKPKR